MALQGFTWGITVMIALFFKGADSQHACASPPINSRLIGGQDGSPGSWPWHVAFTSSGYVFSQGSLITDEWVLTTAQYSSLYFHGGNNYDGSNYYSNVVLHIGAINQSGFGEVTRRIANFSCHQNYTYYDGNDICLVKLSAPVNFTDYIRPVCLAAANSTFYNGTSSWVTGFSGTLGSIQELDVSVVGNRKCNCSYNNYYNYYHYYYYYPINEKVMCAGNENVSKRASYKDEGAALVTKKDSIWVQSGILSKTWLSQTAVYTRVSQYQKWITDRVTGMKPGFVTYTSRGIDSDFNYTCPPRPTTTTYPYYTRPPTTDDSIFGSGEALIPFARVFPLSALVLFLYLFVGGAGN